MHRIEVIDTHTGGEPTRVVIAGGPDLGTGSMAERLAVFRDRHDPFRSAVVNEPRGLGRDGRRPDPRAGRSDRRGRRHLLQQRRLPRHVRPRDDRRGRGAGSPGPDRPGHASARDAGRPRRRHARGPEHRHHRQRRELSVCQGRGGRGARACERMWATSPGAATGSSWSRTTARSWTSANVERLTDVTWRIRQALNAQGITGRDGGEIDHIELFGPPVSSRCRQQELRPLSRPGLRSLPLRHRHQRQARLPGRRRQARRGPGLAAGEHHRQPLRRLGADRRGPDPASDPRDRPTSMPSPP